MALAALLIALVALAFTAVTFATKHRPYPSVTRVRARRARTELTGANHGEIPAQSAQLTLVLVVDGFEYDPSTLSLGAVIPHLDAIRTLDRLYEHAIDNNRKDVWDGPRGGEKLRAELTYEHAWGAWFRPRRWFGARTTTQMFTLNEEGTGSPDPCTPTALT